MILNTNPFLLWFKFLFFKYKVWALLLTWATCQACRMSMSVRVPFPGATVAPVRANYVSLYNRDYSQFTLSTELGLTDFAKILLPNNMVN